MLRYGVFNRLIPDAALSALVDPMEEVAPKINNLRIFRKKSVSAKFKASVMPSGGSSKVKPGLPCFPCFQYSLYFLRYVFYFFSPKI